MLEIPVDSLNEKDFIINEKVFAKELEIFDEKELFFSKPFEIMGKAYIVDDDLIVNLDIKCSFSMPCLICNEYVEKEIIIKNLYISEKLSNINEKYNYKDEVRNATFLEIPSFIECLDNCPKRDNFKKKLKQKNENFPFANLKEQ